MRRKFCVNTNAVYLFQFIHIIRLVMPLQELFFEAFWQNRRSSPLSCCTSEQLVYFFLLKFLEYLDVSVFSFPTAPHLLLCTAEKTCYHHFAFVLSTEQLLNFLLHRILTFSPTAPPLLLCAAGQGSQGLGQKRIARSQKLPTPPSPLFPFPVLQPSRLL